MPEKDPPNPNTDKVAARLNDGLKTCHSIVSNYKALLEADQREAEPTPDPEESASTES